jgi:hypothetical protein
MTTLQKIYSLLPDNITQRIIPKKMRDSFALMDEQLSAVSSGFQMSINPDTPVPVDGWMSGLYPAEVSGTYENQLDNDGEAIIVNDDEFLKFLSFNGEAWSLINTKIDLQSFLTEVIKPYEIPDEITNYDQGNAFLLNDRKTYAAGFITKIKLYSFSTGIAKFQIVNRKTFNANSAGQADYFEGETIFTVPDIQIGLHEYILDTPIEIGVGRSLAQVGGGSFVKSTFSLQAGVDHLGWFQGVSEIAEGTQTFLQYEPFTATFDFTVKSDKYELVQQKNVVKTIIVQRNVADYNSIRDVIKSITDATEKNQYIVYVSGGEWRESDLFTKDFVTIVGAGVINTTIINDPLGSMSTKLTPSDYYFPGESNKQLNIVDKQLRHILNVRGNTRIENLTLYAKDCKYPAHIDDSNYKSFYAKNVRFKSENCNFPIGIGFGAGQNIKFENCIIEKVVPAAIGTGVFIHNRNNQNGAGSVIFDRCKFVKCNLAEIAELGSDYQDDVQFLNCYMTNGDGGYISLRVEKDADGKTFWIHPITHVKEPNPVNVPYSFVINTTGTPMAAVVSNDSGDFNSAWNGIPQRNIATVKDMSLIQEA